jgi:hypothetical protein
MSYAHYRECPARSGEGKERTRLLAELKMEETMLDHFIIATVATRSRVTGDLYKVAPELVEKREACEKKIKELCQRLEDITRLPTKRGEPQDYVAAQAEAGRAWEWMNTAQKNRAAKEQRFHREYHDLAMAIMRTK